MRLLMTFTFLILSSQWALGGCPRSTNSNRLVVTIEGLMGDILFGSPALRLAKAENRTSYQIANYSHRNNANIIAACVQRWKRSAGPGAKVSIIGHSLGGGHAFRVARALGQRGINVDSMMTYDGREGHELACGAPNTGHHLNYTYTKPGNVRRLDNFYQCGGSFPGRYVKDGPGVRNHRLPNSMFLGSAHLGLPNSNPSRRVARAALNDDNHNFNPVQVAANNDFRSARVQTATSTYNGNAENLNGSGGNNTLQGGTGFFDRLFGGFKRKRQQQAVAQNSPGVQSTESYRPTAPRRNNYGGGSGYRFGTKAYWQNHPKANLPAKCMRMGRSYDCKWWEASYQSYGGRRFGGSGR